MAYDIQEATIVELVEKALLDKAADGDIHNIETEGSVVTFTTLAEDDDDEWRIEIQKVNT